MTVQSIQEYLTRNSKRIICRPTEARMINAQSNITDFVTSIFPRPFDSLTEQQQDQARAKFFDAGPTDGYSYELTRHGNVLSRRRIAGHG